MSLLTKSSGFGSLFSLGILVACAAVAFWLVQSRDYVIDQLAVWQYQPSSEVAQIAKKSTFSESGTFYFYASQPLVESAKTFNTECERKEPQSAILGCYAGRRIYIFDVTDARLDGIKEVTAAHEMLHAAWDRMSDEEHDKLAPLLEAAYVKVADKTLSERMDYYARAQPGERANELHSIIATEYRDITPELEAHYKKYFNNRRALVQLHANYNKIFIDLEQRSSSLASRLQALGDSIESLSATYNDGVAELNANIKAFNKRAQSGAFESRDSFDAERAEIVASTDRLEAQRADINAQIASYEALRKELEAVNAQSTALSRSLDSTLAPSPSI